MNLGEIPSSSFHIGKYAPSNVFLRPGIRRLITLARQGSWLVDLAVLAMLECRSHLSLKSLKASLGILLPLSGDC